MITALFITATTIIVLCAYGVGVILHALAEVEGKREGEREGL